MIKTEITKNFVNPSPSVSLYFRAESKKVQTQYASV